MTDGVLRCVCPLCRGGVTYERVSDYLAAHRLGGDEYVLNSEVEMSRDRHPANGYRARVGTFDDGSQILVEDLSGIGTVSRRSSSRATWSAPVDLIDDDEDW